MRLFSRADMTGGAIRGALFFLRVFPGSSLESFLEKLSWELF